MADGSDANRIIADAPPGRAGAGRHRAPEAVWAAARDDYLAGLSAPEVCARHGVGLTALRNRAAHEGWRRLDQPWTPRNRLDPEDEGAALEAQVGGDLDRVDLCELSFVAARRMMRAVLRGDAVAALRWRKVRDAMDAEEAEVERATEQHEAIQAALRDRAEADALDAVDAVDAVDGVDASHAWDGVFAPDRPGPPPGPSARAS